MTSWTTKASSAYLERTILTGMIVSDRALRIIGLAYKPQYFTNNFSRELAKWCFIHQTKYNCAPKTDIQTIFEAHKRNGMDQDLAQLISQLLASMSDEFSTMENFNEQLCIDTALNYFKERGLVMLQEDLKHYLDGGNLNAAHASVAKFTSAPESIISMGFEPLNDMEGTREAFEDKATLFELPGDLGKLIGPFEREWLVMIVGKYKGAKSFTCQFVAQQAIYSGLNVGWFDFELGERRLRRRWSQGICAMPLKPPRHGRLLVPVWDCKKNQIDDCMFHQRTNRIALIHDDERPEYHKAPRGYQPCFACSERVVDTWLEERNYNLLDWKVAWQKAQAVIGSSMGAKLKVQVWPKFSAGVDDIEATLDIWQHLEGFIPDVIIVDQPDIMKMEGSGDTRHKIDQLWMRLGSIAQKLHCLLIAPSQAGGKDAQERKRLRVSDVAEDSRKLGHVDMSIRIDQDELDKDCQRAIYSVGVGRDDDAVSDRVMALQCLALGQAVIDSRFI